VVLVLALGVLLGASARAFAATVSGVVRDAESGAALPYAAVSLRSASAGDSVEVALGAIGDASGRYRILDVPPGRYEIGFAFVAYREQVDSLIVRAADEDVVLDAGLTPQPITTERVVVEAPRVGREKDVQTGVVNLQIEELESVPSIGEPDLIRTLQLLPGVQAASDVSSGLYIRGGGPDQTLILLDDVPVYNPTHAFGFFSTFNSDVIQDVTLYKGAYPAEHGGRLGSVVDIKSRNPTSPRITGQAMISTIAARLTLEGPLGSNHWLVSGRRTYLEPILSALRRDTPEIPYYNFYDLNGRFTTRRDGSWTELNAYRGRDNLRVEPDADTSFRVEWGNTVLSAAYNRLLSNNVLLRMALSGSEYESVTRANFFNTPFAVNNRLRDFTARAELDWQRQNRAVEFGIEASLFDFQFDQSFNLDDAAGFSSRPIEIAAYVDDQWAPREGTSLRLGLRSRYITDGERLLLEPRVSASQVVANGVRVKVGGGIYNQYLQLIATEGFSAADVYVPIDESATPGRSVQGVIGVGWEPSRKYELSVEGYYTDLENLVTFNNNTPADQESFAASDLFHTGGTGYATGVEFFAQRRVGRVTGWLGYTLGWSRRTFEQLNAGSTYAPKYDRRHDVKAVFNYRTGPWSYGLTFVYATGQAFTPASARYRIEDPALGGLTPGARVLPGERNSSRLLPYHRLDFSINRDFTLFGQNARAFLQFFNVYTRRNEWFVQFDNDEPDVEVVKMLPIVPSLGMHFKF
jgi:hypothetical protein